MAEKPGTVSGVQTCHLPATSSSGSSLVLSGTLNSRILGQLAAAISSASLAMPANRWAMPGYLAMSPETTKSMFDCPDPSQTSPMRMSAIRIVFLPAMVISMGSARSPEIGQADHPFPIRPGRRGLLLAGDAHRDLLARIGPPPDRHGHALLQDHVIAE